ncbi:MAG TPA: hypothetical protein VN743_05535 [Blastocatellia bacterium]|nr:hypothetical protein [Blastocatellia bacterium]
MKRTALVLFALASMMITVIQLTGRAFAQSRCSLTEATAPGVRGLKLGMSVEQITALFPGSTKRKETKDALAKAKTGSEVVHVTFEPSDSGKDQNVDVASFSAGFLKGRVIGFSVHYLGPEWKNVDEWIAKLSETLGLPGVNNWQPGPSETPNKVLRCSGIEIEAAMEGGGGSITIRSTENPNDSQDRARDEKKKRDFKP